MMNMLKPTGTADVPVLILQAKKIKDKIMEKEVICTVNANDNDNDQESVSSKTIVDKGMRLRDEDSDKIKKPSTKRNKIKNLTDSIDLLSERQVESAHFLSSTIHQLFKGNNCVTPTNNVPSNIELVKYDVSDIKSHVKDLDLKFKTVEQKLDLLIDMLAKKA